MKNLLYKEFRLDINPLFYLVPLFGALVLIPEWLYTLALIYFLFITVPNVFTAGKAQNDIGFSAVLPVRRQDIVKSRMMSIILLELLQLIVTAAFVAVNIAIYPNGSFSLDANITYIGCSFLIYAVYNIIFFPMFYKTAYKIGLPVIVALIAVVLLSAAIELLFIFRVVEILDGMDNVGAQLAVLAGGIIIFILFSFLAFRISAKRFSKLDL